MSGLTDRKDVSTVASIAIALGGLVFFFGAVAWANGRSDVAELLLASRILPAGYRVAIFHDPRLPGGSAWG